MLRSRIMKNGLFLITALILLGTGGGVVGADDGEVPSPHRMITEYTGPETCAQCHLSAAQDVVESLHYQQQGAVPGARARMRFGS